MKNDKKRLLLTGGGSGGHVYPLVAVVKKLWSFAREEKIDLELRYFGPNDSYATLLENSGVRTASVPAGKIRRYLSPLTILDIPKFFLGFIVALWKIYWLMPDVIFSKGGTGALPVVLAGWFYRIPIIIHESDASPGLNNLISAPFASRIAVSFESALKYFNPKKTVWIGTPLREDIFENLPTKEAAKEGFGFDPGRPLTLVIGGSLGSERINNFILTNLAAIIKETQVLHQTGQANYKEVEKLSVAALSDVPIELEAKSRYKAVAYLSDDLKNAFAAADLVVSRAGSGSVFEIAAFAKPAILIPLKEAANDHQRANAYEFARGGGAVVIEEQNLLPAIFTAQLKSVLQNQETMEKMSTASKKFFKPQAAEIIAQELLRLAS